MLKVSYTKIKYIRFKKITTAKQIRKGLVKNAILFDPLVSEDFYCRRLDKLFMDNSQVEVLFNNVGRDIYSLMALLRAEQIGIIDKEYIYDVILEPTDVKWLIKLVHVRMIKLLGLDKIKIMCHNNPGLYELAFYKRINGFNYDEVCEFVESKIMDVNRE